MKKLSFILSFSLLLFACNDQKTSNEEMGEDIDPYPNVGVENVIGNIPDTINTIDLSTNKVDSANVPVDTPSRK